MSVKPLIMMTIAGLLAPILFGCGGGGDDGVSGPAFGTYARGNPTAEDLLDHWDDPERLRSALGLWAVANIAESRAAIRALLEEGAGGATIGTRAMLRNVQPEDIVVVGERDGITYGQWKGGPAGTLNIEFDWRFAENVDAESRVRMERAGKLWSRRVMDDFGTHVAATGTQVVHGDIRKTLDEEITTNGLVIFVLDKGPTSDRISSGGPGYFFVTADDLEPWLGSILLNRRHHDDTRVMAHEIGHVLGIGSTQNFPSVGRHVNRENHNFEGPEAMRANGGAPVPYQWITEDRTPVAPGTPGAEVDYGHPGVCSSLMAYCSRDRGVSAPDELDFAILDDIGYDILDAATASEPELYGYGAWGRYGAWGVGVERILDDGDSLRAGAHAFGVSPATSLAESTALTGEVTWAGSLLGVDTGHAALPPVFGDAQLVVELTDLAGSAHFDNLAVDVNGASHAFRMPSLEYAVEVSKNAFSDEQGRVRGGFFGPAHEEMAGVLDDRDVRLLAGFGGKR